MYIVCSKIKNPSLVPISLHDEFLSTVFVFPFESSNLKNSSYVLIYVATFIFSNSVCAFRFLFMVEARAEELEEVVNMEA